MIDKPSEAAAHHNNILRMAVDIVSSYVANNALSSDQIHPLINTVFATLNEVGDQIYPPEAEHLNPAVPVKRSVRPDHIICLEDGKKLKMLKRYLRTTHGMTPDEYRAKWRLPADYPMVAPNYAKQRSEFAKSIGLGRKDSGRGKAG